SSRRLRHHRSALAELRPLASLLQPRLAPLLDPGVAGQEAPPLEIAAQLGVDLGKRPGDAVSHRTRLAADPTAMDANAAADVALISGDGEGLADHRLVQGTREELLEAALVDLELAVAGDQGHPRDRPLALAGCQVAGAALHLGGRPSPGLGLRLPGSCQLGL